MAPSFESMTYRTLAVRFQQVPFMDRTNADWRVGDLVQAASKLTGLTVAEIKGPARHRRLSRVRFAIAYVAHRHLGRSFPQIGRALGNRDHTTILQGKIRAEQLLSAKDEHITRLIQALTDMVTHVAR